MPPVSALMPRALIGVASAIMIVTLPFSVMAQPAPKAPPARQGQAATKMDKAQAEQPYGRWERNWGTRPPAPPAHWTKKGDWHRHVRACQQRYRSYNPRTDSYRLKSGSSRRCTL